MDLLNKNETEIVALNSNKEIGIVDKVLLLKDKSNEDDKVLLLKDKSNEDDKVLLLKDKANEDDDKDTETKLNMLCSCSLKEKSYDSFFTLEELQQKKSELLNLQKIVYNLKYLQQKKRKADAKTFKLSLNGKCKFMLPDIKIDFEILKRIESENALIKSELCHLKNGSLNQSFESFSTDQRKYSSITHLLKNRNEKIYKMYGGRVGHLRGENTCVFIVLSSESFYIVHENCNYCLFESQYEDIESVIVGQYSRWLSVISHSKISECFEDESELQYFQVDTGDENITMDIIMHLEISIRRRMMSLSIAMSKTDSHVRACLINRFRLNSLLSLAQTTAPSKHICFSYGRWLDSLLPSVVSFSSQEVLYIENWLMDQMKLKKRPQVLRCWLVFWENGSEFWHGKGMEVDNSPQLNGFLMTNISRHCHAWTPAYFFLKGRILYQFRDACDKVAQFAFRIRDYCGCRKLTSNSRPHAFELIKKEGNSLYLAAPNDEVASVWLQAFMSILSSSGEISSDKKRFKPCQVIQTAERLVLCNQSNILNILQSVNLFKKNELIREGALPDSYTTPKRKGQNRRVVSSKMLHSNISSPISGSSRVNHNERPSSPFECPPTPPLPDINRLDKRDHLEPEKFSDPSRHCLELLSFCNIDQISELYVTSWSSSGCLMELECSEATEIAGDWALYFPSEKQLSTFLDVLLKCRKLLTEEELGLTTLSSGPVHDLLLEGSATVETFLRPCP